MDVVFYQEAENDIELVTQDYMYSAAFQGTPLAKSVLGTSDSLRFVSTICHSLCIMSRICDLSALCAARSVLLRQYCGVNCGVIFLWFAMICKYVVSLFSIQIYT